MIRIWCHSLLGLVFMLVSVSARAQSAQDDQPTLATLSDQANSAVGPVEDNFPRFGGPTSVAGQLAEDAITTPEYRFQGLQDRFAFWYEFKDRLNENRNLQLSIDESMFYQVATASLGESDAASGLVRVYGKWEPFRGRAQNRGMLVFKGENRHRMTAITPFSLGFESGSIVPTGTFFSEFNFGVTNLFWKQYWFDDQLAVAVGKIDVTDFVDPYALMNPLTHFINLSFSTNPTIAVPNQGLGAAMGGMLTSNVYFQAGFSDANGQATRAGFDTFFDDSEFFSYAELGLTSAQDRIYLDNVHVTMWNTDARESAGTPSAWGVAFTAQKFVEDRFLPFFRFGYSDGDAALMQTTFSTGLGIQRENRDVFGLGVSWGSPANGMLRDQFTSECFYRFQLTEFLAVTPDAQLIVDPSLNTNTDVIGYFGVRLRAAF